MISSATPMSFNEVIEEDEVIAGTVDLRMERPDHVPALREPTRNLGLTGKHTGRPFRLPRQEKQRPQAVVPWQRPTCSLKSSRLSSAACRMAFRAEGSGKYRSDP